MAASEVTVPATPTSVAGSRENGTAAMAASTAPAIAACSALVGRIVMDQMPPSAARSRAASWFEIRTCPSEASTISVEPPPMSTTTSSPARTSGNDATTARKRQRRLALAVDHLDLGAQDLGGRVQERGRVGGAPQRLGADGGDARAVAARDRREVAQHGQRARDGLGVERAARCRCRGRAG